MSCRTLVLGDLHLVRDTPQGVVDDLVRLLAAHRGARLVFAGDLFDLSADHPGQDRRSALRGALDAQPRVVAALREHVELGGELWLLGGNHDAALGDPSHDVDLAAHLQLRADARPRVRTSPWFVREGSVHFEHGHLYDPDNATAHPLVANVRSLGVHFVEEFIAPTGAFRYLNANDGTPLKLLASAFAWYGVRGPYVVYKYFDAAFRAALASGPFYDGSPDAREGAAREAEFMRAHAVPDELMRSMLELSARPTMQSLGATPQRLYLDRVAATFALLGGAALLASGRRREGVWALSAGALTMGVSWALGHDRYGGTVPQRLEDGARRISEHTGASLVVMGHAHRELVTDSYANTGSFSFPRNDAGRPYLELDTAAERPRAVLHHVPRAPR